MKRERESEQIFDDPPCCVCMETILDDTAKNYPFRCGGVKHLVCDSCWDGMKQSRRSLVCPMCRAERDSEELPAEVEARIRENQRRAHDRFIRSEERRVGKEGRSR